jgi:hypothetical protein
MNPLRIRTRLGWLSLVLSLVWIGAVVAEPQASTVRPPQGAVDQAEWLENMIRFHRFTAAEVRAATGLGDEVITAAVKQWGALSESPSVGPGSTGFTNVDGTIRLLPYPGGRHPRLGFFEGSIHPQRDTKVSLFTPWQGGGYVVVDVPEAIGSHLGLNYLAQQHVPTIWEKAGRELSGGPVPGEGPSRDRVGAEMLAVMRNLAVGRYELELERGRTQSDSLRNWMKGQTFSNAHRMLRR